MRISWDSHMSLVCVLSTELRFSSSKWIFLHVTAGLIYENLEKMKKFEPKYRLKRVGSLPDKHNWLKTDRWLKSLDSRIVC